MSGPQTRDEVIAWLDAREAAVIERVKALASERGWHIDAESSGVHRLFIELDLGRESSEEGASFFCGCRVDTREPSVWPMIEAQTDADCALAVAAWPSLQAMAAELREAVRS